MKFFGQTSILITLLFSRNLAFDPQKNVKLISYLIVVILKQFFERLYIEKQQWDNKVAQSANG